MMDHFGDSCCEEATLTLVSQPHELTEFDSLSENFDPKSVSLYTSSLQFDEGATPIQDNSCEAASSLPEEMVVSSLHSGSVASQPRVRKQKRPFSPESVESSVKNSARGKPKRRGITHCTKNSNDKETPLESFSCDGCGSQTIVNPARSRLPPGQVKKAPTVRKKVDPTSKQVLSLCNACGLAFSRPPRKEKRVIASNDDREKYLTEAVAFARSLAERLAKPAAERLFCPSFKNRPCGCLQTYISHQDDDEGTVETRVESLLQIFSTACDLNRRKNLFPQYQQSEMKPQESTNANSLEKKQRQRDYEHFILETRQILREKLRLCERACQRILLYSNNFLHKKLKSSPEQSSRISRQCGRSPTGQLKSIDELGHISCCLDNCSRLALTHSTLLMEWRKQATQGQRQARRVLAEMLTPSGGTKANCYKFISMVTGCAPTTISSVSNQMRITKGNREPPEHGLKKWHRVNPRKSTKHQVTEICSKQVDTLSVSVTAEVVGEDSKTLLEQQRKELEEAKHQLYLKQQELDRCHQIIDQHLQQQNSTDNNLATNPLWKVNVIRSSLEGEDDSSPLLNLPVEPNVTMIPELSTGQAVEFIDLVPGTYIAVPSSFDSSTILTMTPNTKESAASSCSFQSGDFSHCQEIILSDELHSSLPNPCKTSNLLLHPESGVQTIYKFSSVSAEEDTILTGVHSQIQAMDGGNTEIFVSAPAACDGAQFAEAVVDQQSVPVISTQELESISSIDAEPNNMDVSNYEDIERSLRTSVITPSRCTDPEKSMCNIQNSMTSLSDANSSLKGGKNDGNVGAYEMSSVILLPSHQSHTPCSSFNTLDRFFE